MCLGHSYAANDALKQRKPYRNHLAAAVVGVWNPGQHRKCLAARSEGTQRPGWRLRHPRELILGSSLPM